MNFQITRKPLPDEHVAHSTALQMQPGDCVENLLAKDAVKLRDAIKELHGPGSAVVEPYEGEDEPMGVMSWIVWRKK